MNIMSQFELFEPLQSAYKTKHSCETALIQVQNNILCAMDQGKVGILFLLDMSAAFETVDPYTAAGQTAYRAWHGGHCIGMV